MTTYTQIKNEVLYKKFDIDGYYGAQCWDGVFYVAEKYLGGKRCHCGISGFVKDVAAQKKTNGILDWCTDVGLKAELKPGDICVWGECAACPTSHIAFYDSDNGQNEVYFLGQNQGGPGGAFNIVRIPTAGIIGVFRPKALTASKAAAKPAVSKPAASGTWNQNAIVVTGSIVKSVSCAVAVIPGTNSAVEGNLLYVPELGGKVPLEHLREASDTRDGACDDVIATTASRVYLDECTVEAVDRGRDLVKVHGYWVNAGPLMVKQ